ncbi:hypothetical protein BC629DRAFT_198421 [Irpex lacteus]|nr:hypothetical protein BC629DRAFT_198421 [Irpex lacteus]
MFSCAITTLIFFCLTDLQCLSVCTPVSRAQELCHGDPSCTCSISPPAALSSCLECHISRRDGLESQWIMATSNARKSYSQLCSGVAPSILHPNYSPSALSSLSSSYDGNSTSSEDITTLSRRESLQGDDYCIYGFPVIRWRFPEPFELSPIIDDTNLFIIFFFILSVIVCVVQNRKTSS